MDGIKERSRFERPRETAPGSEARVEYSSIFPTFFLSGFECSTFDWQHRGRRDLVQETRHREHAREDYHLLHSLGIGVAREGIPWPMIDRAGAFDFSVLDPVIEAMQEEQILPIWDLCHYGYPDDTDPFADDFAPRFAAYCRAAAAYVIPRMRGPHYFTPINEITFFAYCGGEWGWVAPYRSSRSDRYAMRLALCRASIAGVRAIREVDPEARVIHVDPLVQVVAPRDRPDEAAAARQETDEDTFLAWDVLAGRQHPEFGGSPEILDIVGCNCYAFGHMLYTAQGPHVAMDPHDDRLIPLSDMLKVAWERYHRPIIIGETSGLREGRPIWLDAVMRESLAAVDQGIDLHGICLFPAVDMQNWHDGQWLHNGICDLVEDAGDLRRVPYDPYVDELRRWQRRLKRVTELDEDPFDSPVNLWDVVDAAHQLHMHGDKHFW